MEYTDEPGTVYGTHHHPTEQVTWVLTGEITFTDSSGSTTVRAGEQLTVPAGSVHSAQVGPDGARYLVGVSPRE